MKFTFLIPLCLFAGVASATSIVPNNNIEILFVDGQKVEEKREAVNVSAGNIQLVLRYSKSLKDSGKNRVFDSAPYVVMLDVADADLEITAPTLYSYEQANTYFKKAPEWIISEPSGQKVQFTQEKLDRGEGFLPYYDLPKLVAEHNKRRGIVVGSVPVIADKAQFSSSVTPASEANDMGGKKAAQANNLEQLQAWYLKASAEERKAFRRWMIDQE